MEVVEAIGPLLFEEPLFARGDAGSEITVDQDELQQREWNAVLGGKPLSLKLPVPDARNTKLMAHHLWNASLVLCDLLLEKTREKEFGLASNLGNGQCILELGAGAGLPSILCGLLFPKCRPVASDFPDTAILSTLQENLTRYLAPKYVQYAVQGHSWGDSDSLEALLKVTRGPVSLVIMADTLWVSQMHGPLLNDLKQILRPDTGSVIVTAGLHTGVHPIHSFLKLAESQGWNWMSLGFSETLPDGSRRNDFGSHALETFEENRRTWIWMTQLSGNGLFWHTN